MKTVLVVFLLSFFLQAQAAQVLQGDYKNRDDVNAFIARVAEKSDYTEAELVTLFSTVKKQEHLFDRLNRPAERELKWFEYRRIFIKPKRISKGVEFWQKHRKLLDDVSQKTGVPPEIIVAIIGVETFYGIYRGKDPVFDSLVTVAFDYPKRAKFFTRELEEFLLLVKEQNLNPRELKGSYAGAMGMPQFISSSYRRYAVDYDGNGQIDLFDSIEDIVGSVANYFVDHGWQRGKTVVHPLIALENNSINDLKPTIKTDYKWQALESKGLVARKKFDKNTPVSLIKLEQKNHPEYWAGLKNFYVITRYNHSEMYAMAVYQLSRQIKSAMDL